MIISDLPLAGLLLLESEPFRDDRGQFSRLFCRNELSERGVGMNIAQINHSLTRKVGSIRGMHFQRPPHAEIKIIRCLRGKCFDVAVDLRPESDTYLKWHGEILEGHDNKALLIPEGFAHGFQVLEADTELLYLHSEFYTPEVEAGVRFDDPQLAIEWPLPPSEISDRDATLPFIK
ncbi:dTDP-4-dehydrorhamnose 3,5-epimerase [Pseudodesulfovibrio profundus]|uniref:dTDP-4-dehydrorhamnose 3,5-epimerase n=1 Tax=Pseudodesulfovibrio profundus TaxID=57320 RepID=A0A2C8F6Z3_9BACT|nr:dTDP-4-dehydrorhamnose 3,5-epimerase [Pseudodesulfovibrio profundus]MBC16636.1 dTDP-4-dehydrorhamnose 3,5-epimerase [Desulfovibrio sp.]SOB58344.1 dTDP-4-dehydrorhamnose 3,5-epimerase [Pseudodesulfovibrio profundus]|tara:strand:+ start:651 stop:1178 length:528 start_codon:yes stop_codon:yes gene_type:complete